MKKSRVGEKIYHILLILVVLTQISKIVAFDLGITGVALSVLKYIFIVLIIFKIIVDWDKDWKTFDVIAVVFTVFLLAIISLNRRNDILWEYIILILGAKTISEKGILKVYSISAFAVLAGLLSASLLGIIPDITFIQNGVRHALGCLYPTQFSAIFFYAVIAFLLYQKDKISFKLVLAFLILNIIQFYYTLSLNTFICVCVALLGVALFKYLKISVNVVLKKIFVCISFALAPLFLITSAMVAVLYDAKDDFWCNLDNFLKGAVYNIYAGLGRYGFSLMGKPMVSSVNNYNLQKIIGTSGFVVDNIYISGLIKIGILGVIALILLWSLVVYKYVKNKSYQNLFLLNLILVHFLFEHNIFIPFVLIAYSASNGVNEKVIYEKDNYDEIKRKNVIVKNFMTLFLFSLIVEVLAFNMYSISSIFNKMNYSTNFNTSLYNIEQLDNGAYVSVDKPYILINDIDVDLHSLSFSINFYSQDTHRYLDNINYNVELWQISDDKEEYNFVDAYVINSSKPYSGYCELEKELTANGYLLLFDFNNDYEFEINSILINPFRPFNISYIRICIIYLILVSIYYFGVEKKNGTVNENTKEVQKATTEFVSTGNLRIDRHRNMKAVYEAKSPIFIGLKRFFDIFLSGLAIIVLSPLFIATAIAIKIEDKGPAFFVQYRAGKNLKPFKIWKFRSMYVNADDKLKDLLKENEQTGHAFKIKDDPRITKVGKFIRKYSIDELPQLFNVFLGDMSIVGPRPILVFQMEECDEYDRQRLIVQPGLTCIWQVSGRANIKWDKWVELDLDYIEKMSLGYDLLLILKTIPVVLTGDGAF